jgi:hypothetical protein
VAFAWLGALAAVADLAQNVSLAVVLANSVAQRWPTISALPLSPRPSLVPSRLSLRWMAFWRPALPDEEDDHHPVPIYPQTGDNGRPVPEG